MPLVISDDGEIRGVDFAWPDNPSKIRNMSAKEIREAIQMLTF